MILLNKIPATKEIDSSFGVAPAAIAGALVLLFLISVVYVLVSCF